MRLKKEYRKKYKYLLDTLENHLGPSMLEDIYTLIDRTCRYDELIEKKYTKNKEERIMELLDELRELASDLAPTKNDKVPRSQSLNHGETDVLFDIDIFFSRKPGMRRSIQFIASEAPNEEALKLSCMTALASLCNTMIANKALNITKEDIAKTFVAWLEQHGMHFINLNGK